MFNLAIDSKLRGCDVVALKVEDIAPNDLGLQFLEHVAELVGVDAVGVGVRLAERGECFFPGRFDRVVPLANAEFLDARLPTSRLVIIDAGHFVWEEEPARYASAVLDSITGRW